MKQYEGKIAYAFRKTFVFYLIATLLFLSVPVQISEAATVRLNKKTASVRVEKSIRLTVSGTKKSVKWSSSDSSVATVSSGKVTGKKPGKAVISAKVAGKTLKCSVTVKYNASAANKKITSKTTNLYSGILIRYTNKNKYPVSLKTTLSFRDTAKTVLSKEEDHNFCLAPGKSTYMYFPKPVNENNQYIDYADYKVSMSSSATRFKDYTEDITYWCTPGNVNMTATAYNYSGKNLTAVRVSYLLYDKSGRVIAYIPYYPSCLKKGTHCEEPVNYPVYCSSPAKVKGFIDYAY